MIWALSSSWLPCFTASSFAQDAPTLTINEECMAAAYAPDGRIAYAVRRILTTRHLDIERDDIWMLERDGKRKRIVNGEKLVHGPHGAGPAPFSYAVQSLRWSPDGTRLTVEMLTSQMINERGDTQEGVLTLLVDESGKEIRIAGADSVIPNGTNAAWLSDGATVVYVSEAMKPKLLYSIHSVRPAAGRGSDLFSDRAFAGAAWNAKQNTAVAIERDRSLTGAPRLVALDLFKETVKELATLEGFVGGLTLSPSGAKVAYFRSADMLEVRDLGAPERVARVRVAQGTYHWDPSEQRVLIKRGLERKTGDLAWVALPPLQAPAAQPAGKFDAGPPLVTEIEPQLILHGLTFRDFDLSSDGKSLAVIQPGKRNLLIYSLK